MVATTIIIFLMITIAFWANSWLKDCDRLPMQWSLTGKVNWSVPRFLALAFFPSLAVITALVLSLVSANAAAHNGQENEAAYAVPRVVGLLLAIQCVHLLVIARTPHAS